MPPKDEQHLTPLESELELKLDAAIHGINEVAGFLAERGFHAGFWYPDELYLLPATIQPQERPKAYLLVVQSAPLATEEEGIVHELRHGLFQHNFDHFDAGNNLDEAFALGTLGI